jgi:uncharacterized protein (UPF0333 family)
MSAKKKSGSKKRGSFNLSLIIIIVVLVMILSYAISYFFIHDASNKDVVNTQRNQTETKQVKKGKASIITLLEGSWYSTYDGTILSISTSSFKLEFPGVDGSKAVSGSVIINGNEVIFMNDSASKVCTDKPGKYSWSVKDKNNLSFTKINDPCTGRAERMTAGWERF